MKSVALLVRWDVGTFGFVVVSVVVFSGFFAASDFGRRVPSLEVVAYAVLLELSKSDVEARAFSLGLNWAVEVWVLRS